MFAEIGEEVALLAVCRRPRQHVQTEVTSLEPAFSQITPLGKGKYQRRDFKFDVLIGSSKYSEEGSLFADQGKDDIFTPIKTHPPMTVRELAALQAT